MRYLRCGIVLSLLLVLSPIVLAFEDEGFSGPFFTDPLFYIKVSGAILLLGTLIVLQTAINLGPAQKKAAFLILVIPAFGSTLFLGVHTLYENVVSETGGPVHWHADYKVIVCGQRVDLKDPTGITNKIGLPLIHEHNDDRIHIEGTVKQLVHIDLGSYFDAIGGELGNDHITYPGIDKVYSYKNGDLCPDGSIGSLKVYRNGTRLADPQNYVISPYQVVPPGDCLIIKFDSSTDTKTSDLCESWEAKKVSYP